MSSVKGATRKIETCPHLVIQDEEWSSHKISRQTRRASSDSGSLVSSVRISLYDSRFSRKDFAVPKWQETVLFVWFDDVRRMWFGQV